jgi:GTP cyclohydrolase I
MEKNSQDAIEESVLKVLESIGENPDREGLQRTPHRVAKAFKHIFGGYNRDAHEILKSALFSTDNREMVVVKDIEFYSMCEHHMLPIIGTAHVGYIPDGKVTGLSKLPRVVDVFARRLQIQENMTEQIANAIDEALNPKGVGVVITARHMCMEMRGVEKCGTQTTTSSYKGLFLQPEIKSEFLSSTK